MSIVKVAKRAGVSRSTVSRVINGLPSVSGEARDAVRTAIKEIGYTPPLPERRRGPRTKTQGGLRTHTVAVLFTGMKKRRLSNKPALIDIFHGLQIGLAEREMNMITAFVDTSRDLPPAVARGAVDGLLVSGYEPSEEVATVLRRFPAVWVMPPLHGYSQTVDWVYPDDVAVGELAASYLADRGHRQVAFLTPTLTHYEGFHVRGEAFGRLARAHGAHVEVLNADDNGCTYDDPGAEGLVTPQLVEQLLVIRPQVTGIFLATDLMAARVYPILKEKGLTLGKDITVVAFNSEDPQLAGLSPRPATIDIRAAEIGRCAVEQLLWRISHGDHPAKRRVMIEPVLIDPATP